MQYFPIVVPGKMIHPAPIKDQSPILTLLKIPISLLGILSGHVATFFTFIE